MAQREVLINGLLCQQDTTGILISGATFQNKDLLKQNGAVWNPEKKMWVFSPGTDISFLRPKPKPKSTQIPLKKVYRTWICAKKKATIDPFDIQGPMIWVCECHGSWKSDYAGT